MSIHLGSRTALAHLYVAPELVESLHHAVFNLAPAGLREEVEGQQKYIVAPCVMLKEGVLAGSNGPLLYSKAEIHKSTGLWDRVPVSVNHPENANGLPISLSDSPNTPIIGEVRSPRCDGDELAAELWLYRDKLASAAPDVLIKLKQREPVEISTGMYMRRKAIAGEFRGVAYEAIAMDLRPDHLAVLPNQTGACSVRDGCGIRFDPVLNAPKREAGEPLLPPTIDWQEISAFGKPKPATASRQRDEGIEPKSQPLVPPSIDWHECNR